MALDFVANWHLQQLVSVGMGLRGMEGRQLLSFMLVR